MAYTTLSYPFRIDYSKGGFGSVNSDTDTYKAEQIQSFLRTFTGERLMFPSFGIEDPAFHEFDTETFAENFTDFYSPEVISINSIALSVKEGVATDVVIDFK